MAHPDEAPLVWTGIHTREKAPHRLLRNRLIEHAASIGRKGNSIEVRSRLMNRTQIGSAKRALNSEAKLAHFIQNTLGVIKPVVAQKVAVPKSYELDSFLRRLLKESTTMKGEFATGKRGTEGFWKQFLRPPLAYSATRRHDSITRASHHRGKNYIREKIAAVQSANRCA